MRTDEQQKFYVRIALLAQSIELTEMEKRNLEVAKKWLDRGDDFHVVINSLCLGLKSLDSERLQGKLTPVVDRLFKELISVYGELVKSDVRIGSIASPL